MTRKKNRIESFIMTLENGRLSEEHSSFVMERPELLLDGGANSLCENSSHTNCNTTNNGCVNYGELNCSGDNNNNNNNKCSNMDLPTNPNCGVTTPNSPCVGTVNLECKL